MSTGVTQEAGSAHIMDGAHVCAYVVSPPPS